MAEPVEPEVSVSQCGERTKRGHLNNIPHEIRIPGFKDSIENQKLKIKDQNTG
jgi:hypothetical protein